MAESILFGIAQNLLWKLGSLAVQEIGLASGVTSKLNKLKETLKTVQAVQLDADELGDTNRELSVWLESLKDVCYAAGDVLNEFDIVVLRRQVMQRSPIKRKVRYFFLSSNELVFRFKMAGKIRKIRERIDEIAAEKTKFHLPQHLNSRVLSHIQRETHSFINASYVIGRDADKEKMVDVLINFGHDQPVSVIPIIGIGGLGKTTLAKMVYNDQRVVGHFDFRKWVCVAEDFNVRSIIGNIVDGKNLNLEELQESLRQTLSRRRYLLILDDVWNEDVRKWRDLADLLISGAMAAKSL